MSLPNLKFDKPLTFGDKDQIEKIRLAERQGAWDQLEKCIDCEGRGSCGHCDQDCPTCDGLGKSARSVEAFKKSFPGMTGFQLFNMKMD